MSGLLVVKVHEWVYLGRTALGRHDSHPPRESRPMLRCHWRSQMKLGCRSFRCALVDELLRMELAELRNQRSRVQREWFPDWPHQESDFEPEATGLGTYDHQALQASPIGVAHSPLLQRRYHVVGSRFATYGLPGLVVRVERDLDYLAPPIQALQATGPYFYIQSETRPSQMIGILTVSACGSVSRRGHCPRRNWRTVDQTR